VQNFFHACGRRSLARARAQKRSAPRALRVVNPGIDIRGGHAETPYFIGRFVVRARVRETEQAMSFVRGCIDFANAFRCAHDASMLRRVHTSLSGTLLFSLCCSKRNAVRFDSRRALKRHRHDHHG
jgi:hypothetical protein